MTDKHFYYLQLNTYSHPIQLELFDDRVEADRYFNLMLQDKQRLKDSFTSLQNIPIEEFCSLSIIAVHERYGHQLSQACVLRDSLIER